MPKNYWSDEILSERINKVDRSVTAKVVKLHNVVLNKIMIFFTYAGTGAAIWFICLAIPLLFIKGYKQSGVCIIIAIALNFILGELLIKNIAKRKRPSTYIDDEDMLINKPKDPSFPSGHASSSFAAAAVAYILLPVYVWVPALVIAMLIAFSRIYLQVHYLSDVVIGATFGFMVGCTVVAFYLRFFILP